MNISIFGLGYVGCITAACLARNGHNVVGVDVNIEKVDMINAGRSPIVEPGLGDLLEVVVQQGRLRATVDVADAVAASDVALLCVGTPGLSHGQPSWDAIGRVGRSIGRALQDRPRVAGPYLVVLRSTALPGTTDSVLARALRSGVGDHPDNVRVAVNPEFMREGASIHDFDHPPMILVGTDDEGSAETLRAVYEGVDADFVHTSVRTAELVKYASNAYHGLKVCFANEMADLAGALGADANEVMRIFARDRKLNISEAYLRPGFAFGGSCLPKDIRALLWAGRVHDVETPVLSAVLPSNVRQVREAIDLILSLGRRRIGVVGLAFKSDTDDLRESPQVTLVEALIGKGLDVQILDRNVAVARLVGANRRFIEAELPHVAALLCDGPEALVTHSDVIVIAAQSADADAVLNLRRPEQDVVDLTRSGRWPRASVGAPQRVPA
jgi:GDP-mannose 6-dehydrogenase